MNSYISFVRTRLSKAPAASRKRISIRRADLGIRGLFLTLLVAAVASLIPSTAPGDTLRMRLTVLEPEAPAGPFDAVVNLLVMHRDPWHPRRQLRLPDLRPGEPSAWIDTEPLLDAQTGVATVAVRLETNGQPLSRLARVRVELAREDDEPIAFIDVSDTKGLLGFEIPERSVPDARIPERLRSLRSIAAAHREASESVAVAEEDQPLHFITAARATVYYGYSDREIARDEVQTMRNLGFNTLVNLPLDLADETRIPYLAGADYRPPEINRVHPDLETATAHYRRHRDRMVGEDGDRERIRAFAISDEPSLDFPRTTRALASNPEAVRLFHEYLREREITPDMLGADDWADVVPAGPPTADASDAVRRLWYYSARFAVRDQSRRYAVAAAALDQALGDQALGFVNWNNPGIFFSDVSRWHRNAPVTGSHNWFEFSRLRGATCLWIGPGVSESGGWYRSTFRTWSMMLTLLRSAAAEGVGRFGAYVHHQFIPDHRGYEAALSILAVAAHGGAGYNAYVWGPHYAFTEYMWSEKFGHYPHVADAHRLIGRSESIMMDAHPPPAQVAILWPDTSQLHDLNQGGYWTYNRDYLVEAQHVWMALNHRHIPVDFVDEVMIRRGLPERYRVLYVVGPNMESATFPALADWVRRGGILWSSARAMTADEIDRPTDAMHAILGVSERTVRRDVSDDYSSRRGLRRLEPMDRITMPANDAEAEWTWDAYAARASVTAADAQVDGHFADHQPAVLRNRSGRGESWHIAAMPGLAYARSAHEKNGEPARDYPTSIGDLIAQPVRHAGIRSPVSADRPGVETLLLRSAAGVAVSLLNWEAQPLENLTVTLNDIDPPARVRSARLGDVGYQIEGRTLTVRLPALEVIDVILVEQENELTSRQ